MRSWIGSLLDAAAQKADDKVELTERRVAGLAARVLMRVAIWANEKGQVCASRSGVRFENLTRVYLGPNVEQIASQFREDARQEAARRGAKPDGYLGGN